MDILKISQYINPTTGFFKFMSFDFEFLNKEQLDFFFYLNYGDKNPAPVVTKLLSPIPTVEQLTYLATMLESLYSVKWSKMKSLSKLDYDPIHNYKDVLTENISIKDNSDFTEKMKSENTLITSSTKTNTRTDNLSSVTDKSSSSTNKSNTGDSVYGFNAADATKTDDSVAEETYNDTLKNTISDTGTQKNEDNAATDVSDVKTIDDVKSNKSDSAKTRTSTHEGNIGNLTTQQLMSQEIELWKWNFLQTVLTDTKDFLTIPIYLS